MNKRSKKIQIPLIKISTLTEDEVGEFIPDQNRLSRFPTVEIQIEENFSAQCYGVKIEDITMAPALDESFIGVFAESGQKNFAIDNIFFIGFKDSPPLIRKVVKDEGSGKSSGLNLSSRRKTFMTPTPLHIPESEVSPISESTHQMLFLKKFDRPDDLKIVPVQNVLWMHPLVQIIIP